MGRDGVEIQRQDGAEASERGFSSRIPAAVQLKFLLQLETLCFEAELSEVAAGVLTWGSAPGLGGVWEQEWGRECSVPTHLGSHGQQNHNHRRVWVGKP